MSVDLLLLRLPPGADVQTALNLFNQLAAGTTAPVGKYDRHALAKVLMAAEPRFELFQKDYKEISKFEGISEQEARNRDDSVELNGEVDGKPMAQFILYDDRVVIHCSSGTTEREMVSYLEVLSEKTGYTIVDPQSGSLF